MIKPRLIVGLAMTLLVLSASDALAAQKKKTQIPTQAKETPYQYCKRMIARHYGSAARLHHVVVTPSGKINCWYYG